MVSMLQECLAYFSQAISTRSSSHLAALLNIQNQPPHSLLALELARTTDQILNSSIATRFSAESPEFEVLLTFFQFLQAWGRKSNYTTLHKFYSLFYKTFLSWITSIDEPWMVHLLKQLQVQLIGVSKLADRACRNMAGDEHIFVTFELLKLTLQTLEEKGNTCLSGLLLTFNSFFSLNWKVDQAQREQIWETLSSKTIDTRVYPKSQRVTYHYYLGHRLLELGAYAEPHLLQALQLCPLWSSRNHLKIVCAWIVCRLFQGCIPSKPWLQKYQMDARFHDLIQALPQCHFLKADAWLEKNSNFLLKNKVYFILLDQLRYLMIRRSLRCCVSAFLSISDPDLTKPRRMPLRYFAFVLDRMFQEHWPSPAQSIFSAYHKLTHLIAQGFARGYISLLHEIYVMPRTNELRVIVAPIAMKSA